MKERAKKWVWLKYNFYGDVVAFKKKYIVRNIKLRLFFVFWNKIFSDNASPVAKHANLIFLMLIFTCTKKLFFHSVSISLCLCLCLTHTQTKIYVYSPL